ALRNAINNTIKANHGPAWYDSIPQTKKSQDLVLNAKQKALDECGVRYTDDDVICRLTFGFWVYMLLTHGVRARLSTAGSPGH
ncbi:hypothetical protein, partial [Escherichia coli]|uniref:hypothetical protein n=1 Tax=Escherichia coli TaxID=562 RepID=UPI001B8AB23D